MTTSSQEKNPVDVQITDSPPRWRIYATRSEKEERRKREEVPSLANRRCAEGAGMLIMISRSDTSSTF